MIPILVWLAGVATAVAASESKEARQRHASESFRLQLGILPEPKTMMLYHGAQRWDGPPQIKAHRKGHAENGPGIYLTTSWETANTYSKGGGAVYRMEIERPRAWLEDAYLPFGETREFVLRTLGKGKRSAVVLASIERIMSRMNQKDSFPAYVLINTFVNNDFASGSNGPALARFLTEHGIDASHVRQSSEDWVVVFNPKIILSVERLDRNDMGPEFEFDLPQISRQK